MKIRSGIFILLLSLLVLLSAYSTSSVKVYQITDQELTQLEMSFNAAEAAIDSASGRIDAIEAGFDRSEQAIDNSQERIESVQNRAESIERGLTESSASIEKANLLFNEYEKEAKRTQKRLTKQRILLTVLLGLSASAFVVVK